MKLTVHLFENLALTSRAAFDSRCADSVDKDKFFVTIADIEYVASYSIPPGHVKQAHAYDCKDGLLGDASRYYTQAAFEEVFPDPEDRALVLGGDLSVFPAIASGKNGSITAEDAMAHILKTELEERVAVRERGEKNPAWRSTAEHWGTKNFLIELIYDIE